MSTEIITTTEPIIVFKGKLVGDTEETIITPAIIAEKSKPLLALKINGIFDTPGAEEVKKAINSSIKMRTLVEKQADPLKKAINAQAKKDVQSVVDIAQPIYDACYATQNTLQATYDKWQGEVNAAKKKEEDDLKAKTEGRDQALFALGLTFNGQAFVGYGKAITKENLYSLADENYEGIITELETLQLEQAVTGVEKPAGGLLVPKGEFTNPNANNVPRMTVGYGSVGLHKKEAELYGAVPMKPEYPTVVLDYVLENGQRILLTSGTIDQLEDMEVNNLRVLQSGYYLQVIR